MPTTDKPKAGTAVQMFCSACDAQTMRVSTVLPTAVDGEFESTYICKQCGGELKLRSHQGA
jgi:hypothetical protein